MDEVDFTVLAATSVFTDLSEKCPPAEACRDAIDRTARATIRMANSTGGFGQQMVPPSIKRQHSTGSARGSVDHREWTQRMDAAARSNQNQHNRHRSPPPPPQRQQSHQYNLPGITDAYDNVSSGAQLPPIQSAVAGGPYRTNSFSRNAQQDQHQGGSSPDTSAIDPSLLPSPNNNTTTTTTNAAVRTPPVSGGNTLSHNSLQQSMMAAFMAQSQSPQQQGGGYSLADGGMSANDLQMDFLQQVSLGGGGGMNGGGLVDETTGNVDLGMGLGWEGLHHDFSDGQQYDLFDGFFFGGQQGGGGSMGGANGGL